MVFGSPIAFVINITLTNMISNTFFIYEKFQNNSLINYLDIQQNV